jgi:hypothetical protein
MPTPSNSSFQPEPSGRQANANERTFAWTRVPLPRAQTWRSTRKGEEPRRGGPVIRAEPRLRLWATGMARDARPPAGEPISALRPGQSRPGRSTESNVAYRSGSLPAVGSHWPTHSSSSPGARLRRLGGLRSAGATTVHFGCEPGSVRDRRPTAIVTGDLSALACCGPEPGSGPRSIRPRAPGDVCCITRPRTGVEDFRQRTPTNAVAIAEGTPRGRRRTLDAIANTYGAGRPRPR